MNYRWYIWHVKHGDDIDDNIIIGIIGHLNNILLKKMNMKQRKVKHSQHSKCRHTGTAEGIIDLQMQETNNIYKLLHHL